jgi:Domain of Unknown Function (DUF1206)
VDVIRIESIRRFESESAQVLGAGVREAMFNRWVIDAERFGLVVRGAVWALAGVLAMTAVLGMTRQRIDLQGSLALILSNPLRVPIGAVATFGLLAYAVWGYARALFDPLGRGRSLNGLLARLGFLWSAVSYTALGIFSAQLALGSTNGPGASLPFGLEQTLYRLSPVLVLVAAILITFTGVGQLVDSWRAPFQNDVRLRSMHRRVWFGWLWLGRFGTFARGVVFTGIGFATFLAGLRGDPHWAYGVAEFFSFVLGLPAGIYLISVVGFGFIALGLHSMLAAPWMRMQPSHREPMRLAQEVS